MEQKNYSSKQNPKLDMIHTETDENSEANLYIFNIDSGGFVIISASKKVTPILAYSFENNFNTDGLGNAEYFINNYNRDIELVKSSDIEVKSYVSELWGDLESGSIKKRTASVVDPLIETRWNQDCYYNEYAPYDNWGPCSRAYAGCVACAMSQVMKYWNYPEKGKGSHTYIHHQYGSQSADFGATTYRWDEMPNEIWSHNDAIATLMYHCGVSVNMNYGADGSGAQSDDVETAMRMYFGYSSAKYKERDDYSDEEWIAMLKGELDESRPMYFSGSGEPGGHAIVCDGYDNNDYFHFNMGWSGIGDGFYSIDDVNGFHNDEAVVMNIRPLPINPDDNDIIYVTPDGDGDGSSWENATSELHYAASVASDDMEVATFVQKACNVPNRFRLYTNNDVIGTELGGSLKNVIAIASGFAKTMGLGDNCTGSLLTRGMAEIVRVSLQLGANPSTLYGLSGMGDLIATCSSPMSRNYTVGSMLAKGKKIDDILAELGSVAEGVKTSKAICELAKKLDIDVPVSAAIYEAVYTDITPKALLEKLMNRKLKEEERYV